MSRQALVSLCSASLFFVACGKDDSTESKGVTSIDAAFLTSSEFNAGAGVKTLTADQLKQSMNKDSSFYDKGPESTKEDEPDDEDDACFDAKMAGLTFTAEAEQLKAGAEVDLSDCFRASLDDLKEGEASFVIKLYIKMTCKGGDLSALNGKAFNDEANDALFEAVVCDNSTLLYNSHSALSFSGTYTSDGKSFAVSSKTENLAYQGDATGAPCEQSMAGDVVTYKDGCLDIYRDINIETKTAGIASEDSGTKDYQRLEYVGITSTKVPGLYYTGGKFKVQRNNWQGEITYTNATTPPTWSMKTGAATQTGTFGE